MIVRQHCCAKMTRHVEIACEQHADSAARPDALVGYSSTYDDYGIRVHDGSGSVVLIAFCPWCGEQLPNDRTKEAQRIRGNDRLSIEPRGLLWSYTIKCAGDASDVLSKARKVMLAVLAQSPTIWPRDGDWPNLLPWWFVVACAPEKTDEEKEKELEKWRGLSPQQQKDLEAKKPWPLSSWLQWFHEKDRGWAWWEAEELDSSNLRVFVEVEGLPFPSGSLIWLFRAAGAIEVLESTPGSAP